MTPITICLLAALGLAAVPVAAYYAGKFGAYGFYHGKYQFHREVYDRFRQHPGEIPDAEAD